MSVRNDNFGVWSSLILSLLLPGLLCSPHDDPRLIKRDLGTCINAAASIGGLLKEGAQIWKTRQEAKTTNQALEARTKALQYCDETRLKFKTFEEKSNCQTNNAELYKSLVIERDKCVAFLGSSAPSSSTSVVLHIVSCIVLYYHTVT